MQNIVTQVSQSSDSSNSPIFQNHNQQDPYSNGNHVVGQDNYLIHLNIQESHYYLTKDQLMALPETLLLCLFPSGVFLDRIGQVITNLTPNDEVYIQTFPPSCFEYIMTVYLKAYDDLANYPSQGFFNMPQNNGDLNKYKTKNGGYQHQTNYPAPPSEEDLLHEKPVIIVLREDLDYYCVPQIKFEFEIDPSQAHRIVAGDLLHHIMSEVKVAAGNYLSSKTSIFQGLYSSNRLKVDSHGSVSNDDDAKILGAAEQHLMDMLCSSGLDIESSWGNRTQEQGKTVISSLSLCRIANETTELFRDEYQKALKNWDEPNKSQNKDSSYSKASGEPIPDVYSLVPKPDLNSKLLLFWRKPARKCWWGEEDVELDINVYGKYVGNSKDTIKLFAPTIEDGSQINKIQVPVKVHIRRVWTLELSLVGIQ